MQTTGAFLSRRIKTSEGFVDEPDSVTFPTMRSDSDQQANKLFVEAAQLIQACENLAPTDIQAAHKKGQAALQKLEAILAKYPESNIAVELVQGRAVFDQQPISKIKVKLAHYKSIAEAIESPNRFVLFVVKQIVARAIDFDLGVIVWTLMQAGEFEEALNLATQVGDNSRQVESLTVIAAALVEKCDTQRAKAVCEQALTIADQMKEEWEEELKAEALGRIAEAMAKTGDVERATSIVSTYQDGPVWVVQGLTEVGNTDLALEIAHNIQEGHRGRGGIGKARAFVNVGLALARTGRAKEARGAFQCAFKAAAKIAYEFDRANWQCWIVDELLWAGDIAQALNAVTRIEGDWTEKSRVTINIINALIQAGDLDRALEFAEAVTPGPVAAQLLASIATALAHAGDFDRAQELFCSALFANETIRDVDALSSIICEMIKAGETDQALVLADEVHCREDAARTSNNEMSTREWLEMALAGEIDRIRSDEMAFSDESARARILTAAAQELVLTGEQERADVVFRMALDATKSMSKLPLKVRALCDIGNALLLTNHIDRAERVFKEAWDVAHTVERDKLAQREAEADEFSEDPVEVGLEEARGAREDDAEFFRYITDLSEKDWADRVLDTIAQELIDTRRFEQALLIVRRIDDHDMKAAALAKIGFDMVVPLGRSFDVGERPIVRSIAETLLFDVRGSQGLTGQ